jgi:hypothetical protein
MTREEELMVTGTVEKALLELEKSYWKALRDNDVDTVLRLTDDPCILTGAQGVRSIDRETMASLMNATPYTMHTFRLDDDAEVRMLGDDVAILAYKVHEELTVEGQRVTLEAADASTWVRRDAGWLCTLHTESLSGDPFGRDRVASA